MKRSVIVILLLVGVFTGLGYGLVKAANVEVILGTSSGFNVVRGTSVSSGTSTLYIGSSTVSIGTTTQNAAMLYVAGSSTSSSDAALKVGTATLWVGNDGAIGIGTTTPSASTGIQVAVVGNSYFESYLYAPYTYIGSITAYIGESSGTVTVYGNTQVTGTLTAGLFIGDGSALSGITATSLGSASNINTSGTINAGSTTVSTFTTTGSATVTGTLTAAGNNFTVDGTTGSMTAASITIAPAGTLTVAGGAFKVDETGSMTTARVTASSMTVTTGTLTVAGGLFMVDETGSMTAKSVTVSTGTLTAGRGAFKVDENGSVTAFVINTGTVTVLSGGTYGTITTGGLNVGTISASVGIGGTTTVHFAADIFSPGTITAARFAGDGSQLTSVPATGGVTGGSITIADSGGTIYAGSTTVSTFTTTGSITAASGGFVVDTAGSLTASTIKSTGSITASVLAITNDVFKVDSTGSVTASTFTTTGSITAAGGNFVVDNSIGSMTAKTITSTGSITVSGGLFVVDTGGSLTAKTITSTGSITVLGGRGISIGTNTPPSLSLFTILGSNMAGYGTTTPMLAMIVGSSTSSADGSLWVVNGAGTPTLYVRNDNFVGIGTITNSLDSTLIVGSEFDSANNRINRGTITAAFLSIGTITANASLHGTDTVHIHNLYVSGTKSFLIPHPDPAKGEGWVLRHNCVESPSRGDTLYRFKIIVQSDGGESFVQLPSYWLYLNENPDVWVSPVNQFARGYGYVDEAANRLVVRGEKKGTYNVLLMGTRKDKGAKGSFDDKGVEYIDEKMFELLTYGEPKEAKNIQLINVQNDSVTKNSMDPIDDEFGLVIRQ